MIQDIQLLFVLAVFAGSLCPGNAQEFGTGFGLQTTGDSTSKIIRFYGNSYIRYDLNVLPAEMLSLTHQESVSMQFVTGDSDGLIWIFKGSSGQKAFIITKDGGLSFTYHDGRTSPESVRLPLPGSKVVNNMQWHTIRIDKEGRNLKFYVDDVYSTALDIRSDVTFVGRGEIFLGGSADVATLTNNLVTSSFDGAVTDVESKKVRGPGNELIISFLQSVESADRFGKFDVIGKDDWNRGNYTFETPRPPPTPSPAPRPTPVTFTTGGSVFYLADPLDMRGGGSVSFRFRTLEPRGIITIARGSAQSANFFAIEVFDGILYFVHNLGSFSSRNMFSDRRVDDGEWHEVTMTVEGSRLTLSLDGRPLNVQVTPQNIAQMYFYRLYVGGFDDFDRIPWAVYSRLGYKGCFEALKINNIGVDLHRFLGTQSLRGVQVGCASMARLCQTQPCVSGLCRDRMTGYNCDCANTPYTGQNCNNAATIAGWDGSLSTTFTFVNREVTHTNDLSVRFMTHMANTILFRSETDNKDDFIHAQLENGRAKITIRVDGQTKTFFTGNNLNDYFWHTLYVRRRADDVEVWVDNEPRSAGMIGGKDYKLHIDRIKFGAIGNTGELKSNNYIGYMQNFMYEDQALFEVLKSQNSNSKWIINTPIDSLPLLTYKPVTLTTSGSYFQLPSMRIGLTMKIMFKFKTREADGLILYNAGSGNDVIAIELSQGRIRLAYNLGGRNMFTVVPGRSLLNDNNWHTVIVSLNERGQFSVRVDNDNIDVSTSDGDGRLDLSGALYIGGMPDEMFRRPAVTSLIESKQGFKGCLASVDLNGAVPELMDYTRDTTSILQGCTDVAVTCKPNVCGPGVCMPGIDDHWCDCNMTGYVGIPCTDWPVGYYFGKDGGKGIVMYEFPYEKQFDSNSDMLAFGFMTREEDGVLYRIENAGNEFIEIRLENGFIIAESNTGSGLISMAERAQKFNDGLYHVVRYIRTGTNSSLQVDTLPTQTVTHSGVVSIFNKVYRVILGGRTDDKGAIIKNFYGIMGGAFYNGYRWFDLLSAGKLQFGELVRIQGNVVLTKPFLLVPGSTKTTAAPPDIIVPVGEEIPSNIGGGGVIGTGIGGDGTGPAGPFGIGGPGGSLTPISGIAVNVPGEPLPQAVSLAGPGIPTGAAGARAGAVVGTVLGTLAFFSSLMWALYKLKPGVPAIFSPGAGAAGGGAGMSISAPRATSNIGAVQAVSGGGGAGVGGGAPKVTVVNGSAAGGGAAGGGGSSTYTSYFQSTSTSVGGAGGGSAAVVGGQADTVDSSTLRATGYSAGYQSNTMQSYGSSMGGGTLDRAYDARFMSSSSAGGDNIPDYDLPVAGTLTSGHNYSSSTLNTHYNYQVQNFKTVTVNKQGQFMMSTTQGGAVTPGAAADEVRVDCCLMTNNGNSVITGSSLGPPQVWDMQTGELQNIMKGDTVGSTNLHLVCGDRLLVGAVHADMEINEYSSRKGVFNHTLQIWDFQTGRPLSMAEGEYCSALCPMSDSDKVLFGRTDKFGDATSIIAWDLMGNQMIKEMRYDAPVGNNDYISYLNKSKNDRYIVAGFTNSFDNQAEFMTFDMTLTSYNINEPSMLKLDANPECTAILPKDEAVTGLRNGDLVIWNIRTAQPSRQLLGSGGAHAHSREVKSVTLSEDARYLVSASADGTLKVWDMHTERPIHTLHGHSDEVWCSAISNDNEIVVSGSADGTIRLWRMKNGTEMCTFNCGVDIFYVTMSRDKGTIVALGDKYGARKLIMLQVVRTKIKKIVSS